MCHSCQSVKCQNPVQHTRQPEAKTDVCCVSTTTSTTCCTTTEKPDGEPDDPASQGCCNSTSCNSQSESTEPEQSPLSSSDSLSWRVTHMDCPSCAAKLETALGTLEGVASAHVRFATEKLIVTLDKPDTPALRQAIEDKAIQTGFPLVNLGGPQGTEQAASGFARLRKDALLVSLTAVMSLAAILSQWQPQAGTILFMLATILGLLPIVKKAITLARSGSPFSIETLMSVAALGALYLGETVEAAMVLVLFLIGERLEGYASAKARAGIQALMALVPESAIRVYPDGRRESVPVSSLQPGQVIEIAPGGRLPADAVLQSQTASFDMSALTGESIPVEKGQGEKVPAGAMSVDRVVTLEVVSKQGESAIDRILTLIEDAESRRAPVERFIDRFSRWYTPLMILVAALVVVIPPVLLGGSWDTWVYRGLALLLIACPCALVISTPAAMTSGLATAARYGALIKGGAALEALSNVEWVAFDKTGTLTEGKPVVTDVLSWEADENKLLALAAGVEQGSHHPLAKAVVAMATSRGIAPRVAQNIHATAGKGVAGEIDGQSIEMIALDKLPDNRVIEVEQQQAAQQMADEGKTVAIVFADGNAIGALAWRDELRATAKDTIAALNRVGVKSVMLTGDNPHAAAGLARLLGMDFRAGLMPEGKVDAIREMSATSRVAMVGDGINDAPAMKSATIGIAMGGGTDVALETADIALSQNRIEHIPSVIALSRATMRNVRQNVALAIGLKAIFLVTSVLGLTGLWVAVLADSGATAIVTLNALRLLRFKNNRLRESGIK
ncbi:zinc/cadmium/mercury/lead-transporting ATPase [Grimontia hollisae]|uniref:zinc/cadmium/mercury/lead-transporting ATPase n=1 Tax=Grimontia hollisae TaxID=673 RepID=UPI001303D3DC|nr:zinc/cadmium/mercury/lead-transporting ATPase [Grimontia hollisae]MDF2185438.1 zinc/cadmium/mercury/lead-transporting ATPase [Grimontia hollisae]